MNSPVTARFDFMPDDSRGSLCFVTMVILCVALTAASLFAQRSFEIAGHSIGPGSKQSFELTTASGIVPVTVLNGGRPGPVLTLTAGIRGDEYPPIRALQRLASQVRLDQLSGTVLIVHLANSNGFHSRTIARNLIDVCLKRGYAVATAINATSRKSLASSSLNCSAPFPASRLSTAVLAVKDKAAPRQTWRAPDRSGPFGFMQNYGFDTLLNRHY